MNRPRRLTSIGIVLFALSKSIAAPENPGATTIDYAGKPNQWAYKTAIRIEAFMNPEEGVKLNAMMTAYRRAYPLAKAQDYIGQRIADYRESLRKSDPNYKPSDSSTYGRALGTGLLKDSITSGLNGAATLLAFNNPGVAVMVLKLSDSDTFKQVKQTVANDLFERVYNPLEKSVWGSKAKAVRENLETRRLVEQTLDRDAGEAHIAYWLNPAFRELYDSVNQDRLLTPISTREDLNMAYPSLKLEELKAEIDDSNRKQLAELQTRLDTIQDSSNETAKGVARLLSDARKKEQDILEAKTAQDKMFLSSLRIATLESGLRLYEAATASIKDERSRNVAEVALLVGNGVLTYLQYDNTLQKIADQKLASDAAESATSMADLKMSLDFVTLAYSAVTLFANSSMHQEDTTSRALQQIGEMIRQLTEMVQERLDRLDARVESVLTSLAELRSLVEQGNMQNRRMLDQLQSELGLLHSELYFTSYQGMREVRQMVDEHTRTLLAAALAGDGGPKTIEDSIAALTSLSQIASVYSREEQRTATPSSLYQPHLRTEALSQRDITELGGVMAELLYARPDDKAVQTANASLNLRSWSEASLQMADLLVGNSPKLNDEKFRTRGMEAINRTTKVGLDYIEAVRGTLNQRPPCLAKLLDEYDRSAREFLQQLKQSARLLDIKGAEQITADKSPEELYAESRSLPQPKWGAIHGAIGWETYWPKLPTVDKLPDAVWTQVSPVIKLYAQLGSAMHLEASYVADFERYAERPAIGYDESGKQLTKSELDSIAKPDLHFPRRRIFWVISVNIDGKSVPVHISFGESVVFHRVGGGVFEGPFGGHFDPKRYPDIDTRLYDYFPFVRKALYDLVDYQPCNGALLPFATPDTAPAPGYTNPNWEFERYTRTKEFYDDVPPASGSAEEKRFLSVRGRALRINYRGYPVIFSSTGWMIKDRLSRLDAELRTKIASLRLEFTGKAKTAEHITDTVDNDELRYRLLGMARGIEFLYPCLDADGIASLQVLFNGPQRLLDRREIVEDLEKRGLTVDMLGQILDARIKAARGFLGALDNTPYVAPQFVYQTLDRLEQAKSFVSP